ncbi:MAG: divergent PAP2 family protein, partial [Kiritimatiellales bacterium]
MHIFHVAFWAGAAGWMVAQITKMVICLVQSHRLDFRYLVSTGGMPSAHSALASAIATAIGLTEGFNSALFTLGFFFAAVVMFDAQTVRAAAGEQARLLNLIVDEVFKEHHLSEKKLKELLGHTRLEVFFGMLTGIFSAMVV